MFGRINKRSLLYWLITAAGIYALLPFILIAPYNHPAADDFGGAVRDAHKSFTSVFTDTYLHWSGRYFATVIARINPLLYHSFTAYKWYAVVLLAAFVTALIVLLRVFTARYFEWRQTLAFSALFLFLYLGALPGTAEGFYWFSGAYVYQTANILFMLLVAVLPKLQMKQAGPSRYVYFSLAALLAICIIGCNEISLIITCCVVIFFTVSKYFADKKLNGLLTALTVICVIAACAAVFAPGNFERMKYVQEYSRSLVWAVAGAGGITYIYITQWAAPLLIATILYIPVFGNPLAKKMIEQNVQMEVRFRHTFVFFIVSFVLLQVFTVWVAGGSNLGRIENVIYVYFLLGYFFNVQLFILEYWKGQKPVSTFSRPLLGVVYLLFFISVCDINNNISTAYIDVFSGKAKRYSEELDKRMQLVKQCYSDTCYVQPLTTLPKTIFFTDIKCTKDSIDLWMNEAYTQYFGSGYVIVTAPLPAVQTNLEAIKDYGKQMRSEMFEKER